MRTTGRWKPCPVSVRGAALTNLPTWAVRDVEPVAELRGRGHTSPVTRATKSDDTQSTQGSQPHGNVDADKFV